MEKEYVKKRRFKWCEETEIQISPNETLIIRPKYIKSEYDEIDSKYGKEKAELFEEDNRYYDVTKNDSTTFELSEREINNKIIGGYEVYIELRKVFDGLFNNKKGKKLKYSEVSDSLKNECSAFLRKKDFQEEQIEAFIERLEKHQYISRDDKYITFKKSMSRTTW